MFGLFPICCLLIILIVSILRGPSFPENYFVIMPQVLPREKKRHEYHEAIKKRYRHLPEVNRIARWFDQSNYFWEPHMAANIYIISYMFCKTIIAMQCPMLIIFHFGVLLNRHRHLPRPIYKAATLMRVMADARKRKEERRKVHSAPGSVTTQPLRRRRIIKEVEWGFFELVPAKNAANIYEPPRVSIFPGSAFTISWFLRQLGVLSLADWLWTMPSCHVCSRLVKSIGSFVIVFFLVRGSFVIVMLLIGSVLSQCKEFWFFLEFIIVSQLPWNVKTPIRQPDIFSKYDD